MSILWLICLGLVSGAAAGLLAGLIGIGGGIVIVPVMYYGLTSAGVFGRPGGAYCGRDVAGRDPARRHRLILQSLAGRQH